MTEGGDGEEEDEDDEYSDAGDGDRDGGVSIDDLSSNFTARSNFTPADGSVASYYKHGGK